MAKKKPIYTVWCTTKFGTGVQAVKADNKIEARKKFKKRFPKSSILSIDKWDGETGSSSFARNAI